MSRAGSPWLPLLALLSLGMAHCSSRPSDTSINSAGGSSSASNAGTANSGGGLAGLPNTAGAGPSGGAAASTGGGAAGTGGATGGASGSANADRGPTRAMSGVNFPFPQNRQSTRCAYPAYANADVRAAFDWWKKEMVTSDGAGGHLRVKRMPTDSGLDAGSTVSEGIGYGMLIAVYMNDQTLLDELWKYEQQWLSKNGLMDWYIDAAGSMRLGTGAASDADEDMAFALLMADRQWGGNGTLGDSYLNVAKAQIQRIWDHEIYQGKLLKPGDAWDLPDPWTLANISYFAPSYYRAFMVVSGNMGWNDVIKTSYDTLENSLNDANKNVSNGLVPAWSTSQGVPTDAAFKGAPTNYQYDSCRTPFRIGIDYCLNGEPRAKAYAAKTSQFFGGIGAASIVDGYNLDGSPQAQHASGQSAAFLGPATVSAMTTGSDSPLLGQGYTAVATRGLLVGGEYYDGSWTMLSLLMLSGNFLDYTLETPLAQ
ncbi:MAG TPA: glycosyl hydrolase family 8 [Polyangiaceae bacterium]